MTNEELEATITQLQQQVEATSYDLLPLFV